jgi:hypothetical protein
LIVNGGYYICFLFFSFLASRDVVDREARPPKRGLVGRTSGSGQRQENSLISLLIPSLICSIQEGLNNKNSQIILEIEE